MFILLENKLSKKKKYIKRVNKYYWMFEEIDIFPISSNKQICVAVNMKDTPSATNNHVFLILLFFFSFLTYFHHLIKTNVKLTLLQPHKILFIRYKRSDFFFFSFNVKKLYNINFNCQLSIYFFVQRLISTIFWCRYKEQLNFNYLQWNIKLETYHKKKKIF